VASLLAVDAWRDRAYSHAVSRLWVLLFLWVGCQATKPASTVPEDAGLPDTAAVLVATDAAAVDLMSAAVTLDLALAVDSLPDHPPDGPPDLPPDLPSPDLATPDLLPAIPDAGSPDAPATDALGDSAATPDLATSASSCAALGVVIDAHFAQHYTCVDLGPVPGVPPLKYGGLTLTREIPGTTLLIGGDANFATGKLYSIAVTRDVAGHIDGFYGTAVAFADAPFNDAAVAYGPEGVLFVPRWPSNELQQIRAGSTSIDKVVSLQALGVAHSSSCLGFVPLGFAAVGTAKLTTWSGGHWYTLVLRPDGQGTFDVSMVTHELTLPGGPTGFTYVSPGSVQFAGPSLLLADWSLDRLSAYEVDDGGDPRLETRRTFLTGLDGPEGMHRDRATGDVLVTTWGDGRARPDRVIAIRGFTPGL
jgi:hypothetical protein